jgi:hypothetical protein
VTTKSPLATAGYSGAHQLAGLDRGYMLLVPRVSSTERTRMDRDVLAKQMRDSCEASLPERVERASRLKLQAIIPRLVAVTRQNVAYFKRQVGMAGLKSPRRKADPVVTM